MFKSKLECHGFIRAFLSTDVESVALQVPRISYVDAGRNKRRYTGDLLVRFSEKAMRRPLVIECKYASALQKDSELVKKLKHVGQTLNQTGYDFEIQTERMIRKPDLRMMRFVFDHINNDPHPATVQILECVATHGSLRVESLIKSVTTDTILGYQLIPEIWRLVARRELRVDFQENLDLSAKISLPVGMSS